MDEEWQEQQRQKVLRAVYGWFAEADLLGPEAFQLLQRLSLDFDRIEDNKDFLENLRLITLLKQHQDAATQDDYSPWPRDGDLLGEVPIGFVLQNGARVGLTLEDVQHHVFVAGQTGMGKTSFFHILLLSLLRVHKVPVLLIDQQKDFRHLLRLNGRNLGLREVQVFRPQDYRVNPLQPPPGVSWEVWRDLFCRVFCQAYYLLGGSLGFLRGRLEEVYAGWDAARGPWPSVFDLCAHVKGFKLARQYGREAGFYESTKQRLEECCLTFAQTFDCAQGFPLDDLLDKTVVLEVGDLDDVSQRFFLTLLLVAIFQYRKARYEVGPLRHVIFMDEAKRLYHAERENTREFGPSVIAELTAQVRKFGEGLVVCDHFPREIGKSIRGSARTQVCFRLTDGEDVAVMGRGLSLSPAQQADLIQLQPGQVLVRTPRYPQPVVVQLLPMPDLAHTPALSDAEVTARMEPIVTDLRRHVVPRPPVPPASVAAATPKTTKAGPTRTPATEGASPEGTAEQALGPEALKVLLDILEHPFDGVAARYVRLEVAPGKGQRLKNVLRRRGLIEEVKVDVGGQGGIRHLLALTAAGLAVLGPTKRPYPGRGGLVHCFWQDLLAQAFQAEGCTTEVEATLDGHGIDLLVFQNGERVAVEVGLTSAAQELTNLTRDRALGVDRVILACADALLPEVQRGVDTQDLSGGPPVHVVTLRQLYQDLRRKRGLTLAGV